MGPFVNAAGEEKVSEGLTNGFILRVPLDVACPSLSNRIRQGSSWLQAELLLAKCPSLHDKESGWMILQLVRLLVNGRWKRLCRANRVKE